MRTSTELDALSISLLMVKAGLGTTFQKMTPSAIQKAIHNARASGETSIKRGGSVATPELLESILANGTNHSSRADSMSTLPLTVQDSDPAEDATKPVSIAKRFSSDDAVDLKALSTDAGTSPEPGSTSARVQSADADLLSDPTFEMTDSPASAPDQCEPELAIEGLEDEWRDDALQFFRLGAKLELEAWDEKSRERKEKKRKAIELQLSQEEEEEEEEGEGEGEGEGGDDVSADSDNVKSARDSHGVASDPDSSDKVQGCRQMHKKRRLEAKMEQDETSARKKFEARNTAREKQLLAYFALTDAENTRQPVNAVSQALVKNFGNKDLVQALDKLPKVKPVLARLEQVEACKFKGFNYVGRVQSRTSGYRFCKEKAGSNGFTTQNLAMPAAGKESGHALHGHFGDMTEAQLIYMIAHHLMWSDQKSDEFLSWSNDPLFLFVHGLNRYHENQGQVTIQFNDRRKATDARGKPKAFYPALDLYDIFQIANTKAWVGQQVGKLYPRKFTQEFLTHGVVLSKDLRFKAVSIEDLISGGLYELFPAFEVRDDHERTGLYTAQVYYRTVGYPPDRNYFAKTSPKPLYSYEHCARNVPFTIELLQKVQKLARLFMRIGDDQDPAEIEPHLHVFISLLTLQRRPDADKTFMTWIEDHYTAQDVRDLYDDGDGGVTAAFTEFADNLPGVRQYVALIRDAAAVFGLSSLPPDVILSHNRSTGRAYAAEDMRLNRNDLKKSTRYDADVQQDDRDKRRVAYHKKKEEEKKREEAGLRKQVTTAGGTTLQGIGAVSTILDASASGGEVAERDAHAGGEVNGAGIQQVAGELSAGIEVGTELAGEEEGT